MSLANRFFIVGIRPVRLRAHDGGLACEAFNWKTGDFGIDNSYLVRVVTGEGEVEEVSEGQFDAAVKRLRKERGLNPQSTP
jgi:hypothetical protein